jgi:thiol-disulfide isomerase/thioredoxin
LAWLVPVALLLAPAARAGEVVCRPDYDWSIEVDGDYPPDASFYKASARGKFFIDITNGGTGYFMDLQAKKIYAVSRDRITQVDGGVKVPDTFPPDATVYAFIVDGPMVRFKIDGKRVRILPSLRRPPLIGPVELDDLLADRSEYREVMKSYRPDPTSMMRINKSRKSVELEVYFGTWCAHCKKYMPKVLSVVAQVRNPNFKVSLIGVPRNFGTTPGPWQGKRVQTIPAVIVKFDGREITRLGTQEGSTPEIELASLIQALP